MKFLALGLPFLILCVIMWLQGAKNCEKLVTGALICVLL